MDPRPWHESYDAGVPPSIDYQEVALPALLERSAARFPEGTAIHFLNTRLSWRKLKDQVDRLATAMASLGVEPGSRVAIHLPNLPQTVIAYHAALSLGAQVVMTNPLYTPREIQKQWGDAGCTLAVTADFLYAQKLREIRGELPVQSYVLASIPEYLRFPLNLLAPIQLKRKKPPSLVRVEPGPGLHFFKDLVRRSEPDPPRPAIDLEDIAVLQYTGGTTGASKAAILTHRNLSYNVQQIQAWLIDPVPGEDVLLAALPLFHVFGMTTAMNLAVLMAGAIVLIPDPRDTSRILKSISRHRVTLFPGVPAMFNALCQHPDIEKLDVRSLKSCFSGSAPIPVPLLERFEELSGARILEGFGLTETSGVSHVNTLRGPRKVGSVGIPVSDTECRIVDVETGEVEMPPGQEGELLIRGPQVTRGYWNQPEETEGAIRDGWLFTGDLAVMDPDGFFRIVGRKKDMISRGGLKVFPNEVDEVLMAHEDILESATIGVPDPRCGETVKSFVVLQPGRSLGVEEIESWCRQGLAPFKIPQHVEFLDELPKNTVLKVLRRELREREARGEGS